VPDKAVVYEQIKKLMGWCPMKDSRKKERQEDFFSGFRSENGSLQISSSPASLGESRTLKACASIFDNRWILWIVIITFLTFIVSLLIWTFSPEGSFLILFSGLIWFLLPLIFFLNRPNTVEVISGKILIKRPLHKPFVLEKEDFTQISVKKNKDHSLRWFFRLLNIALISLYLVVTIMMDLKALERSSPEYHEFSTFLIQLSSITTLIVLYYNGELEMPYQQIINITTRSNFKLRLYIDEPEEILGILKNEE
jgi:hypothetical protein